MGFLSDDWWLAYGAILHKVTFVTAIIILYSTLDDFFIDMYYWVSRLYARIRRREPRQRISLRQLRAREERPLALMVPAWKEYSVIAQMVENTFATVEYSNFVIFIGSYQNDPETTAEANRMERAFPGRLRRARVPENGPTCKADCLNWILRTIKEHETEHAVQFAGIIMHDCEDVIHPLELKYFNVALDVSDMIQMPVLSLQLPWYAWFAGTYMDDFSEVHQKDIVVRQKLTGMVPGAGVALCYSRRAIAAALQAHEGRVFNTGTLTEDYDFSFRLNQLGMKESFANGEIEMQQPVGNWWKKPSTSTGMLATCEYFPKSFRTAYRQRARWVLGISFLGWRQLGWRGSIMIKYMFFRDRKGIVTAPFSMLAYFVLANILILQSVPHPGLSLAQLTLAREPVLPIVLQINFAFLFNRVLQRMYFVTRLNGLQQGLMSVPRSIVNNFVNFFAVSRAWNIWIRHLINGKPITWDKTIHFYPITAVSRLSRSMLGDMLVKWGKITPEQLQGALDQAKDSGVRLGQILLADNLVSREALADALAVQADVPRISLDNVKLRPFDANLSSDVIERHRVVPFSTGEDKALNVAVACLPDASATQEICAAAGRKVAFFIACDDEVSAGVETLMIEGRKRRESEAIELGAATSQSDLPVAVDAML